VTKKEAFAAPPKPVESEDACDGLLVSVAMGARPCIKPGTGQFFKDCPACPEVVLAPSGSFSMGSPESEPGRTNDEGPQHRVTFAKPFAVGRFAVTFAEWDACVAGGGCGGYKPSDEGWGRADRPVINVNRDDAQAYVKWLSKKTGRHYRLLSEAEREYVTRAGKQSPFWWGASISPEQANYDGKYTYNGGSKGEYRGRTLPVKSFDPNPWGLYQVHGNVWEWVEDCWVDNYNGAPSDGSAWTTGECGSRVLRGGSWNAYPQYLRAAYHGIYFSGSGPRVRSNDRGFRVALGWQDLNR
jgi:formylglycine-generating enzyme required for sulfatase activity